MAGRYKLSEQNWRLIEHTISLPQRMGRPHRDDRQMLNGIFWILCSGTKWRDLPERYGLGRRCTSASGSGGATAP